MRGADGNPHQVRIEDTRAVELAGHGAVPIGVTPATLEVAPNRDLFVPFEFPVAELSPGWYEIECDVAVDGSPQTVRPGSRFAVPWPRGATRRDHVGVGTSVDVGGEKVRIDRVECRADSVQVLYKGAEAQLTLSADGARLPAIDATFDPETGAGGVTAYPLLKTQTVLTVAVKGAGHPIDVRLP
jgi:hypothetical protein